MASPPYVVPQRAGRPSRRCALPLLYLFALLATFFIPAVTTAQTHISADSLVHGLQTSLLPGYKLREGWRFSPGHDPAWAASDHDDSAWQPFDATFPGATGILPPEGWPGHGWFRLDVLLADDVRHTPLVLLFSCLGAAEIYVDGRRVRNVGIVGIDPAEEVPDLSTDANPIVIPYHPSGRERVVFAVRFSNHYDRGRPGLAYDLGFDLDLAPLHDITLRLSDLVRHRTVHSVFFAGVTAAASLLRILLYVFYPASRQNLYYALFVLSVTLAALLPTRLYVFTNDIPTFTVLDIIWKVNLSAITLLGLRFLYTVFDKKPPFMESSSSFSPFPISTAPRQWSLPCHFISRETLRERRRN